MEWKYIKKLQSEDLIHDYETLVDYQFSDSFKECVKTHNGGRPSKCCFDTDMAKGRAVKTFLSFNKNSRETVWKIFEWSTEELTRYFIPFAIDNFGNLICFNSANDKVVFVNHEDKSVETVADDFDRFMDGLYDQPEAL